MINGIQKLPLLAVLPDGAQKNFLYNLIINYVVNIFLILFHFYISKNGWSVLSIIRCNKYEKKKLCVNFSMSAGPFKQTGLGGGHQAAVSRCK